MTVDTGADDLIQRVRARRRLPTAEERRAIRTRAGVSLRDMAAAVGVSHAALVGWERGANPRDPEHLGTYGRLLRELDG